MKFNLSQKRGTLFALATAFAVGSFGISVYAGAGLMPTERVATSTSVPDDTTTPENPGTTTPATPGGSSGSGSSSSGTGSGTSGSGNSGIGAGTATPGTTTPDPDTTTPENPGTTPDTGITTPTDSNVATLPDGTKVEKKTEIRADGTKVDTTVETRTDGSKTETIVETAADGAVKTIETVTETDGAATKTENEATKISTGKLVDLTTTTKTDASGNVTGVTKKAVIEKIAANTSATITVKKNASGKTTAANAAVSKTVSGNKVSLTGAVIAQLREASGEDSLAVTLTVKDNSGKTKFKLKADADDLQPGNELFIYQYNSNTGEYVMVNAKTYKVNTNGSVGVSMSKNATYQLMSQAEAAKVNKQILKTVKVQKASATIKPGKSTKLALSSKLNKANVKSVKYSVPKNAAVKVSNNGKITAKKAGTVTVKATVTLKNGTTKTVKMKITVK